MRKQSRSDVVLGLAMSLAVLGAASACEQPTLQRRHGGASAPPLYSSFPTVHGSSRRRPSEDLFVSLGEEDPTFSGVYIDNEGRFVALSADSTHLDAVRTIVQRHVSMDGLGLPTAYRNMAVIVQKADFSFQQLSDLRDLVADSLLGSKGVIYDDLDEVRNRVTIGYDREDATAVPAITQRLAQLGVPLSAVYLDPANRIVPDVLEMRGRGTASMTAGLRITDTTDTLGGGFAVWDHRVDGTCCLGSSASIVADLANGTRGFIVASHATDYMYTLNYDGFWESDINHYLGSESEDPAPTTCSIFQTCADARNSDAAFVTMDGTVPGRRGAIARLQGGHVSNTIGSLYIDATRPWINVTGVESSLLVGTQLDKVGERTGWTYGTLNGTCIDYDVTDDSGNGKQHRVWCTGRGDWYQGQGDSGAPVFLWDGSDGAIYYGDVSSSDCPDLCNHYVYFSPFNQITTDLGTLNVNTIVTMGTLTLSGTTNANGAAVLTWNQPVVTNSNETTQFTLYRAIYNDTTTTSQAIYSTTATSYTDTSIRAKGSPTHTAPSGMWAAYWVIGYNAGLAATSDTLYYSTPFM